MRAARAKDAKPGQPQLIRTGSGTCDKADKEAPVQTTAATQRQGAGQDSHTT